MMWLKDNQENALVIGGALVYFCLALLGRP